MRQTTVFVVDDEEEIGALLTRILARDGLRVAAFRDAAGALEAAGRDPPDAVLTDLTMPGTSGLELAARVKELHPHASVVVMTPRITSDAIAWPPR